MKDSVGVVVNNEYSDTIDHSNGHNFSDNHVGDQAAIAPEVFEDEYNTGSHTGTTTHEDDTLLNVYEGAALLTADCLGTGILALPEDIHVLGKGFGLTFLILNLPVNFFAGLILAKTATYLELRQHLQQPLLTEEQERLQGGGGEEGQPEQDQNLRHRRSRRQQTYTSVSMTDKEETATTSTTATTCTTTTTSSTTSTAPPPQRTTTTTTAPNDTSSGSSSSNNTSDYINLSRLLFNTKGNNTYHDHSTSNSSSTSFTTRIVMILFYMNIFLVLGDYLLVMSHAISAMIGEQIICLPVSGILACVGMFLISSFMRKMVNIGRSVSYISLLSLLIVIVQCVIAAQIKMEQQQHQQEQAMTNATTSSTASTVEKEEIPTFMRKLSALASICFAVGSQKLFLNIRYEMKDRNKTFNNDSNVRLNYYQRLPPPVQSLGISLTIFGTAYVIICLLTGPDPPSFLFDDILIPPGSFGWNRRIAGLLLWIHVTISYAINSQALCSSIDSRIQQYLSSITTIDNHDDTNKEQEETISNEGINEGNAIMTPVPHEHDHHHAPQQQQQPKSTILSSLQKRHKLRWTILTFIIALSSYIVANAVPFFKDLVALIGSLTSVPLTLMLPAIFYIYYRITHSKNNSSIPNYFWCPRMTDFRSTTTTTTANTIEIASIPETTTTTTTLETIPDNNNNNNNHLADDNYNYNFNHANSNNNSMNNNTTHDNNRLHLLLSYVLLLYSIGFFFAGLSGALDSIDMDWENHGPPFSCH